MTKIKSFFAILFSFVFLPAWADVIDIVVPNPPGGTTDVVGRYISSILTDAGITNIVRNKPGAQGVIGTRSVVDTTKKNTTLLILGTGPGLYAPLLLDSPPYDVQEDFRMVASVVTDSIVIVVPSKSPINDVGTLITQLKQRPGEMTLGHGASSHRFAGLIFLDRTKTQAIEVPYNGANPMISAIAGHQIDFGFVNYTEAQALHRAGQVKIIGIASRERHHKEDTIRTFREQGIDFEQQAWFLVAASKDMDTKIVRHLNKIINDALKKDISSLLYMDMSLMIRSPEETDRFVSDQYDLYRAFIESVRLQQKKSTQ